MNRDDSKQDGQPPPEENLNGTTASGGGSESSEDLEALGVVMDPSTGNVSVSAGGLEAQESCKRLRRESKLLNQLLTSSRPDEGIIRQQMRIVEQERSDFETWKKFYDEPSRIRIEEGGGECSC